MSNIWHDISPSRIQPEDFVAVIEIPKGSKKKYELDKETGLIILDRVLHTSTHYPANYGFIPRTYGDDGDPLDVLVLCSEEIDPLTLVRCYPIGYISMLDGGKNDEKIIAIPFSDPTAEGPVIQGANLRALKGGVTTDKIFALVEELRKDVTIPLVFMTYANVVFSYGIERFAKKAATVGMDGVILPDVPFEEKEEFASVFRKEGMDLISLIAPTSHDRISMIAKEAEGFVYCVSSLGVTGMRSQITTDVGAMVELVKKSSDIPAAIGFGISGPEQAKKMAEVSDGVIVGSAIVKLVEKYGKDAVPYVAEFVKSVKDAIRE